MSAKAYKTVAATLVVGGALLLKKHLNSKQIKQETTDNTANPPEKQICILKSISLPIASETKKKTLEKKPTDIIKLETQKLTKPLELWRYVPLKTTSDDYLHYFNPERADHKDHKVTIKIPHLKQHSKYPRVLKHLNLSAVPSNKPEEIEIVTFDKDEGEEISENVLVKKAYKLVEMDKRLKNGEKLKPSDWSSPTKEELHKDAKVNAMFLKIPK